MVIGISGGIGSGKSVMSRILRCRGYRVYDCDLEARRMMDSSEAMIAAMRERWGDEIYDLEIGLDRREISRRVFSDDGELGWLNSLVHGAVRADLEAKILGMSGGEDFFIESAILYSSGLWELCDEVWEVNAPEGMRIARVMNRNGLSEAGVRDRIETQRGEEAGLQITGKPVRIIANDGRHSLLYSSLRSHTAGG